MKKIAILIAVIMILLSACNTVQEKPTNATETITGDHGCSVSIYDFTNLEAYTQFFSSAENLPEGIPEDFVKWEDVNFLGTFVAFGFNRPFDYYWYGGEEAILYIDHNPGHDPYRIPYETLPVKPIAAEMTSMSNYPGGSEGPFVINRNGLIYRYSLGGSLLTIIWCENGVEYRLSGELYEYPVTDSKSVISRLLSVSDDVANAAIAEIRQNLNHETS